MAAVSPARANALLLGDLAPKSIGASVVTARLGVQSRVLLVDRGSADGVRADMAVIAWGGAVGRVVGVERAFARVRLLSDPNSGASGVIVRSRTEGMVVGRGGDPPELIYVPKYADVVVGDRVVTSGLDGVFPRGFGLGRVTVVGEPVGASKSIRVEPEVDDRAIEDVLILLGIGLSLVFELGLGRFAPGVTRYVVLMTLPLVTYALRTSQRSSMMVGCA